MIKITFTDEERTLLVELLENDVSNMHTSSFEYKESLKAKRDAVKGILLSVKEQEPVASELR